LPATAGALGDALADFRLSPQYPSRSPLEEMLRLIAPGSDSYRSEKYAAELNTVFETLARRLRSSGVGKPELLEFLDPSIEFPVPLVSPEDQSRAAGAIDLRKRTHAERIRRGADLFAAELAGYFSSLGKIATAEFEIVSLTEAAGTPLELVTEVHYSLLGARPDGRREERIGFWQLRWSHGAAGNWRVTKWECKEETVGNVAAPLFADLTAAALGHNPSYREQLAPGIDHWRTVLDGACGIDVYGNHGVSVGDFDADGNEDIYVCQPSGLPNRLYRNRGNGSFEDATLKSGLGVLDATACAIFADFENKGLQDLLVVTASGPLLFLNRGNGEFVLKADAFSFAKPPEGTFTHAAVADYDRDGRLDIYFCLYSYYLGLDQYHYPAPYFDARNGPPNFLFHNEGNARFVDRTAAAGLDAENDRFSFACAWGDISGQGGPDLYVANDFGRSNLYRNLGDGTFVAVSEESGVNVPGAGMSACWCDFQNRGKQDIYVSNMWSAAGQRVSEQELFHAGDPAHIRAVYRRHARGNSLYRNKGDGKFEEVSAWSGVEMGRWAWSSDAWDFDADGYPDLYIANGYISGTTTPELASFFWRQVVGNSPVGNQPLPAYERGWNAINELIRSDHSWNGYERNTMYRNNRDGTFSEVSGLSGLDFLDDSRSFALADLDGDGRVELVLKNRTAPQIRILRNVMPEIGDSVCFRLRGTKSSRDAIGAAVTVECGGLRQTKYLQAGSGFLSQHTKELFFGLGKAANPLTASIRWPSGLTQHFEDLPPNHRIAIEEARADFSATPFATPPAAFAPEASREQGGAAPPGAIATWLVDPLLAPDFSLPDLSGRQQTLSALRGRPVALFFWAEASPRSVQQLRLWQRSQSEFRAQGVAVLCLNVDRHSSAAKVQSLAAKEGLTLPILVASPDVAGVYNIIYRYLFDRRRDLPIPCSFLLEESGLIARVYQGLLETEQILGDSASLPRSYEARVDKALPFKGTLYNGRFARNDFTYGVALFHHGYYEQAAESFKQVIAAKPDDVEAYYNLGTLYLRKNELPEARRYLEQTVKLRPEYPEAWNNLGMIAGQQNQLDDAIRCFTRSLSERPDYVTALVNLGNVYRRQGNIPESTRLLTRAVELEPDSAEANYSLGMLYARQNDLARSADLLQKAVALRPDYPDAINNLGVVYVRQGKNELAEQQFSECIRVAPSFDQAYLNLARLYVLLEEKEKAREILQALLKLQPDHKLAQQALEMLN
jgi:Flp pilus assembly protein TadD/peroxiredoxin